MRILILISFFVFCAPAFSQTSLPSKIQKDEQKNNRKIKKSASISAISTQVDAMKTEIMSEKLQVLVLKDLLKKEGLDGTRKSLTIAFKNELGKRYLVDSVTYKLNGEIIYQFVSEDRGLASSGKNIPLKQFETKVVPGPYSFEVQVIYRGNDSGVFSYVKDYRITREDKMAIDVKKANQIIVSAYESGGVFADFKDRPQLKVSQTE